MTLTEEQIAGRSPLRLKIVEVGRSDGPPDFLIADEDVSEVSVIMGTVAVYAQVADRRTAEIIVKSVHEYPALLSALAAERDRADRAEALLKDANTPYTQREIGNLVFDGNSVSFWRDKAKAYGGAASALRARVAVMQEALEIIAGKRQCLDNLMGNKDVALAALTSKGVKE